MAAGKILIVDDSPTNLRVLLDYLEKSGFDVLVAPNGERALRQLDLIRPDLILLDVLMPGIDGFETCRRLKMNSQTRNIPVIFMTALSDPLDKVKGFEVGGVDYVTKPLQYQEVLVRVNTHLKIRQLQEQLQAQNIRLEAQNALLEEKNAQLEREIAERAQTEQVLKQTLRQIELAKQEWESTADSLSHLVCLLDRGGHVLRANRAVEHWQPGTIFDIKGQPIHALLHPTCHNEACYLRAVISRAFTQVARKEALEEEFHDDILRKYVQFQVRPIFLESDRDAQATESFAVCILHDITSRKAVEQALHNRTQELQLLNDFSDALQGCQTQTDTYSVVTNVCEQFFPGSSGVLFVPNHAHELQEVACWGEPTTESRTFGIDDLWIFDHQQTDILEHHAIEQISTHIGFSPDRQHLCAPILAEGDILAILSLQNPCLNRGVQNDSQETLEASQIVLKGVIEHYALTLVNLKLRETLRLESILDPLTGLYNRRHMEASLTRETRRAQRYNSALGCAIIDVDHFKRFNDIYSHDAGDIVLQELGGLFQRHTRAEDIACRYGGEEFVLILPEATLEDTQERAEELRVMVKELQIRYLQQILNVTVSIGVAALPVHGVNPKALLHAADEALYQAKSQGRDRVCTAAMPLTPATQPA